MKKLVFLAAFFISCHSLLAQQKPTELDKSPMDVSYYPSDYPLLKMKGQVKGEPMARLIYSRPQKKDRKIFGEEVKYNEVWRLGANEATELELFKNATIGGKKIPKGRYTIYCIPTETKWTIVVNKDNYNWGSFTYKPEKDVTRIDVPVQKINENVEALTMFFDIKSLVIEWDTLKVEIPAEF
jgi:hypothetical protein